MPKGYNKDGSKKVRPAGSGRKPKGNISISPQITPEAAAVLKSLKKQKVSQNNFISQAILEKAANDASKRVTVKLQVLEAPGQVDLVDLLQEIRTEKASKKAPPERLFMDEQLNQGFAEHTLSSDEWPGVVATPVKEETMTVNIVSVEDYKPTIIIEETSELSKPNYLEERKSKAYAGMLERVFTDGERTMSTENALAKIMRIRRKGKVDALEVLMECHNLDLCNNNGISISLKP